MTPPRPVCLYEDHALLVLLKPAGLLCVPGRGPDKQDCLSARAQAHWPDALVVHRLDMATSGLVLFARGIEVQRALSRAFAQREQLVHRRGRVAAARQRDPVAVVVTVVMVAAAVMPGRRLRSALSTCIQVV